MPKGGLEPPRVAPYAPQTYVSTNSTTSARGKTFRTFMVRETVPEPPPEPHWPPERGLVPASESADSSAHHR